MQNEFIWFASVLRCKFVILVSFYIVAAIKKRTSS